MFSLYHPVGLPTGLPKRSLTSSLRQRIARAMSFSALQNAADVRRAWTGGNQAAIHGLPGSSGAKRAALIRAHAIFLQTSRDWQRRTPIKLPG
jgi:hypothetical protein